MVNDSLHRPAPKPPVRTSDDTLAGARVDPDSFPEAGPPPHHGPGGPGPVERAERFSLMMKNQLLLEDEQYQAVRKVNLDHAFKMKEIHDRYRNSGQRGLMAELATAEAERDQQISEILSPAQYEQYTIMMDRIKKAWVHRRRR